MPWFPDFVAAAEPARREMRVLAGQADPVACYLDGLTEGDARSLEASWPGEVVVFDPAPARSAGHRNVTTDTVASTCVGRRAVVELLVNLPHVGAHLARRVA